MGFTLVELLIVVIIIAILAAIAIPKFTNAGLRGRESALRGSLKQIRNAVSLFQADTSYYPNSLSDLTGTSAPNKVRDLLATRSISHPFHIEGHTLANWIPIPSTDQVSITLLQLAEVRKVQFGLTLELRPTVQTTQPGKGPAFVTDLPLSEMVGPYTFRKSN